MALIKINDDNNKTTVSQLISYSITPSEDCILLDIFVLNGHKSYKIQLDILERNAKVINNIKTYIETIFDNALINNKIVVIEEHLSRQMMIIGEDRKEFRLV